MDPSIGFRCFFLVGKNKRHNSRVSWVFCGALHNWVVVWDFVFSPPKIVGEDEPILTLPHIFQMGWFNHQLDNILRQFSVVLFFFWGEDGG